MPKMFFLYEFIESGTSKGTAQTGVKKLLYIFMYI